MIQKKVLKGSLFLLLWGCLLLSPVLACAQNAALQASQPPAPAEEAASPGDSAAIIKQAQENDRPLTPQEAFKVLGEEAEKGNPEAMLNLGMFYERGYGVPRHMGQALSWYQKAAARGLAQGYYNTGVSHEIGIGTTPNMVKAISNYEKASRAGLALADYKLADIYYKGNGVKKSEAKALGYLIKAAETGHPQANSDLGGIYHQGLWGQAKDLTKAATHIKTAAEAGLPEAMKNMASLYLNGEGVKLDIYEAVKWYRLAQMAGYPGLDWVIKDTAAKLSEEQNKKLDDDLKKWVDDYTKKNNQENAGEAKPAS